MNDLIRDKHIDFGEAKAQAIISPLSRQHKRVLECKGFGTDATDCQLPQTLNPLCPERFPQNTHVMILDLLKCFKTRLYIGIFIVYGRNM